MRHKITISLISFNQLHYLKRLLPSLLESIKDLDVRILLVANRCRDGTISYLRKYYPDIDIFDNPERTGYGGNHNINLRRANSDFFVIMNSDMIVKKDTFCNLLQFIEADAQVGLVGPRFLNEDGSLQPLNKRHPTVFDLMLLKFCPTRLRRFFKARLDAYEMLDTGYATTRTVPLMSGAFMFCREPLLKKIGGFDEGFFMYFEDLDLCRRIQQEGFETYFCPQAEVVHFWEMSAYKSWKYFAWCSQSAIKYFCKWGWRFW